MQEKNIELPRFMIAATQSGSGKTTITSGIIAVLKKMGLKVQAFKVGPDYIDPGYLTIASGCQAENLDTWLMNEHSMTRIFAKSASTADIAIVEGAMGLFDGGKDGVSSSAEISKILRLPVVLIVDAKSMGESAAAVAAGFMNYDPDINICGVIINRLGSENHRKMICDAMERIGIPVLGTIFRDDSMTISERPLGLLPAWETDSEISIQKIAEIIENKVDITTLIKIASQSKSLIVREQVLNIIDRKVKIGVAKDAAFSFYYKESLQEFINAGAELVFFSPLHDKELPNIDGLIFGGGFPELYAKELSDNSGMMKSIKEAADNGVPVYAECGGFMYLTEKLTDSDCTSFKMASVIPVNCKINKRLQSIGYIEAKSITDTVLCPAGTVVRGHEFHFSSIEMIKEEDSFPWAFNFHKRSSGAKYMSGYASKNVLASYLHIHFAGHSHLALNFVLRCVDFKKEKESLTDRAVIGNITSNMAKERKV